MIIHNLLDMMIDPVDIPNEYMPLVEFTHDIYWYMAKFLLPFSERFDLTASGIPQRLTFEIDEINEYREHGLYWTDDSHIVIKWRPNAPRKMEDTVIHELTHLMLVEALSYNPEDDHSPIFFEFIRRFKRFWRKELKNRVRS